MPFPQMTKDWTIYPNIRTMFSSLVNTIGWFAYENKTRLLQCQWSLFWSCDGATGPTNSNDRTDRIVSAANFVTRGANAASAQSWFVLTNTDGVQLLFAFQGASDDVMRISYSPGGLFTLATPSTNQPTATDEVVMSSVTTVVNNTTNADRVMSVFCAVDSTAWRVAVFRQGTLILMLSLDKVTRIAPVSTFPTAYVFGNFVKTTREVLTDDGVGNVMTPTYPEIIAINIGTSYRGWGTRVLTAGTSRLCRLYGAGVFAGNNGGAGSNTINNGILFMITASTFCASMGGVGALCWPIVLWGEDTVNLDGPWCTVIDWTQMVTTSLTSPGLGTSVPGLAFGDNPVSDPARTNYYVALGAAAIWPWKDCAPAMEQG